MLYIRNTINTYKAGLMMKYVQRLIVKSFIFMEFIFSREILSIIKLIWYDSIKLIISLRVWRAIITFNHRKEDCEQNSWITSLGLSSHKISWGLKAFKQPSWVVYPFSFLGLGVMVIVRANNWKTYPRNIIEKAHC